MEIEDDLIAAAMEKSVADLVGEEVQADENLVGVASDEEEQPGDVADRIRNASNVGEEMSTSFHLHVSGTEDEEDSEDPNSSIERRGNSTPAAKLLSQSPLEDKESTSSGGGGGGGGGATKRKRYEVRRSGSEECLLGFDEQSGEAELVRGENEKLLSKNDGSSKTNFEGKVNRNSPLPPAAKKLKQGASGASPARASPKHQPTVKPVVKADDILPQDHVVADDANGNGPVPPAQAKNPVTPVATKSRHNVTSSGTGGKKTPTLSAQNEFYRKPFEYGWKRELVWRANLETSKDKADVYFISPNGKKLRTRNDIVPLLEGELTIDHFNFAREPLGAGPEYETVRSAKPSSRISVAAATLAAAPPTVTMGKRISKPKGPKGASPPPQGWTPTRALKVNNAALLSSTKSHSTGGSGGSGSNPSTPIGGRSSSSHNSSGSSNRHSKAKKIPSASASATSSNANSSTNTLTGTSISVAVETTHSNIDKTVVRSQEPCTMACSRAKGEVPQLQCMKCMRLYHHQCVGLSRNDAEYRTFSGLNTANGRDYICEACQPTLDTQTQAQPLMVSAQLPAVTKSKPSPTLTSAGGAKPVAMRPDKKLTQSIAVVKGKKYVVVAKPNTINKRNAYANDIENDLKQINESIRNSRKPSSVTLDPGQTHGNVTAAAVDQSNKLFATNFFANVSFAYDALLCILKYLKIHERPRAASVCKLWNLAAKDTSLWHTVRMKNSKVCNWSGFAAALRRGETKHLDLRKMLLAASTRGDEMWQDFNEHIGTVCSLEVIDLCRCSARVVESLFQSNKYLRVLNAIAINDDTINLEHIGNLRKLEELRLRTCEPGVLTGELQPLKMLNNLAHLSLTAIRCLGGKGVEILAELTQLRSLELGECGDFDETFANVVLPKLKILQRLRLENGQETACCTLAILDAVAQLEQLQQLELVNFDIKPGFDERMSQCTNLRKLLIIPTYISQSATTNHIVLSAVQQVSDTLRVFTWGVTVELLRVTALYVDQCEESSKKEKHHFDECIPVLKPVPGAPPGDDDGDELDDSAKSAAPSQQRTEDDANSSGHANDVPQIEILPLEKVESILADNLPSTKYTIVKVPYHATCKQQLVE